MAHPTRERLSVLIVDDDEEDAIIARSLLGAAYDVHWARGVDGALELAAERRFDACLVDVVLGVEDGIEAARRLQAVSPATAIIMLTGHDDPDVDLRATEAGAADYLVKGRLDAVTLERSIRYSVRQQRTLAALEASEERYALVVLAANDGVWDWSVLDGRVYWSPRLLELLGVEPGVLAPQLSGWLDRVHPEDAPRVVGAIDEHIEGRVPHVEVEHRVQHADGSWRWMLARGLAMRREDGTAYRMAGTLSDISARKAAEDRLIHEALHDALTGLPNRALFLDRLHTALRRGQRMPGYRCGVIFLDLDGFKVVNDSLGHVVGDQLLISVARRLEACIRPGDTVARMGGDEFTLLLDEVGGADEAAEVAARVGEALRAPLDVAGQSLVVTASMGIALSDGGSRPHDLVRDADIAMYQAKARGKARAEVFDRGMHDRVVSRLSIETALRSALEAGGLPVAYQPIVALADERIVGFEALARWPSGLSPSVDPADFVPVAEETGLIRPLGQRVLWRGASALREWREVAPDLTLAVNISSRQLAFPEFASDVVSALDHLSLAGRALVLEITESTIMDDPEAVRALLHRLASRGVRAHVDDFGTGYSSLAFLHRFPGHALKIDRSFISSLMSDGGSLEIVRATVALAHALDMKVVAEGVETEDQLAVVRSLGCDLVQGFYYSPPVAQDRVGDLLERWNGGHRTTAAA